MKKTKNWKIPIILAVHKTTNENSQMHIMLHIYYMHIEPIVLESNHN